MNPIELLDQTLAMVVERVGDPAPLVYRRLFEHSPELQSMFVLDNRGSVRAEMFLRGLEALMALASGRPQARGMIACEWSNHQMNGVTLAQFNSFFEHVIEVFRQALGADWSAEIDGAWRMALHQVRHITAHAAVPA